MTIDEAVRDEEAKLDGCYVLQTDLKEEMASKETVHDRYKDLAKVEWAFRTSKTVLLEMRPVCVRLARRTRGHAFVVMLAYCIARELARLWREIDLTVEEGIGELSTLCAIEIWIRGKPCCNKIPEPRERVAALLRAAEVNLPEAVGCSGIRVATRKKLTEKRKTH